MVTKISAGLLMFREREEGIVVFLAHPGGPFFRNKDDGVWTIPKGGVDPGEDLLAAAKREFSEETGIDPGAEGPYLELGSVQQSYKTVHAWAFHAPETVPPITSQLFELEWPPHSGKTAQFPEIDRAEFFTVEHAREKMLPAQLPFIERLLNYLIPRQIV